MKDQNTKISSRVFMKTVWYKTTLFYYDGPQVFEAHDAIGGHYVGVAVTLPNGQDSYLVKGVKPNRAAAFRMGEIDLRTLLLDLEDEQWYLTESEFSFSDPILLLPQEDSLIESEFLPDEGFLLHEIPSNDFVVKKVIHKICTKAYALWYFAKIGKCNGIMKDYKSL